jgi:hypothetical protein
VNWTDPQVQIAVIAASAAIFGAVLGSVVGAVGAWIVAKMNRDEAREARFATDARRLAAEMLRGTEDRVGAVNTQVIYRRSGAKRSKAEMPVVGADKPMWLLTAEIHLTAQRSETGNAAYQLWKATRLLVERFEVKAKDVGADGKVKPIDDDTYAAWEEAGVKHRQARRQFIDAVRSEFRLPLLWGEENPDRD